MRHLYVLTGAFWIMGLEYLYHPGSRWASVALFLAGTWMYVEAYRMEMKRAR